jgi:hypothetical protein
LYLAYILFVAIQFLRHEKLNVYCSFDLIGRIRLLRSVALLEAWRVLRSGRLAALRDKSYEDWCSLRVTERTLLP